MPSPIRFRAFYRGRMLDVFAVNPMNQTVYLSHQQLYDEPGNDVLVPVRSEMEPEGAVLMQWTGLVDRDRGKIYGGDIIEWEEKDKPYSQKFKTFRVRGEVYWSSGFDHSDEAVERNPILLDNPSVFNERPGFSVRVPRVYKRGSKSWSSFANCEVIGNVHQHPELLGDR